MKTAFEHLHINAFRGLRNVRLEQLGRVNLLVGGNNSGKTSVLEAAMLFGRPADSRTWMQASGGRETRVTSRNFAASVRWLFPVKKRDAESLEDRPGEPLDVTGGGTCPIQISGRITRRNRFGLRPAKKSVPKLGQLLKICCGSRQPCPPSLNGSGVTADWRERKAN
jgi:hypothetical protein